MSDFDRHSRLNKFEKRRKNTKMISILLVVASILIIILLGIWIFGGKDSGKENQNADTPQVNETDSDDNASEDDVVDEDESANGVNLDEEIDGEASDEADSENNNEVVTNPIESSDEENVISAYTGNWQPVGTEQAGPHTTTYDKGSQDRIEMERAIRLATKLAEDQMTTWWLENGGDQKVIATVSSKDETEIYRVYLSWIDNQGWQPTKVEVLNENDQKWRFQ